MFNFWKFDRSNPICKVNLLTFSIVKPFWGCKRGHKLFIHLTHEGLNLKPCLPVFLLLLQGILRWQDDKHRRCVDRCRHCYQEKQKFFAAFISRSALFSRHSTKRCAVLQGNLFNFIFKNHPAYGWSYLPNQWHLFN